MELVLMNEQIELLKNNFFKIYSDWIEGEYELSKHVNNTHRLKLNYCDLNMQPVNTSVIVNNQMMHRLYIPSNEKILQYQVTISNNIDDKIIYYGDYDTYVTCETDGLIEAVTNTILKPNIVYVIPAGQYYQLVTPSAVKYFMILKYKSKFKENPFPKDLKNIYETKPN